ncbi:MAG: DciA family protein [Bdellovibrionota bacterium]
MSKSGTPRIGELLGDVRPLKLIRAWRLAAGPIFGAKAKFHGLQTNAAGERVLILDLDDPIWKQELLFQSQHLLDLYREALKAEGFRDFELPVKVSLTPSKALPLKPGNPQLRRHK